jgi:hypothetical protein
MCFWCRNVTVGGQRLQAMKAVKTHTFKHLQRFSTQAVELLGPVLAKNLKFCERLPC